jgi:nitroreductase
MKITTKKIIEIKKPTLKAPILKELKARFSPRVFNSKRISDKMFRSFFEAARWAPSGYNSQPWYFYYSDHKSSSYKIIKSCLSERNDWAKTASAYVLCCSIDKTERGPNRFAVYDLGAAVMSLIIEAQSSGIYTRQMGLFDVNKVQKLLNIPLKYTPFIVLAMGKIGDYSKIDQELLKRELIKRERKKDLVKKI